jgi:hypothetical protein
MTEELNLITFNAIAQFVNGLNGLFGKKYRSLALYNRLISKTTIMHQNAISKHIQVFRKFCTENRSSIVNRNTNFTDNVIFFSESACIFMNEVFELTEKEEDSEEIKDGIWKHLLTISALVDPCGRAKEILKKSKEDFESFDESVSNLKTNVSGNEAKFITDIIDKVENSIDPNAKDPMAAVSSIISSGVFTELIGNMNQGMQNGQLDIGKMLSVVNGLVSSIGNSQGDEGSMNDNPMNDNPMNMLSSMMGALGGMNTQNNSPENVMQNMMQSMMQFSNNKEETVSATNYIDDVE